MILFKLHKLSVTTYGNTYHIRNIDINSKRYGFDFLISNNGYKIISLKHTTWKKAELDILGDVYL